MRSAGGMTLGDSQAGRASWPHGIPLGQPASAAVIPTGYRPNRSTIVGALSTGDTGISLVDSDR